MNLKRIKLKAKSPEFADDSKPREPNTHSCDMPGCPKEGLHKAPKSRDLSDYYFFCLEHVQDYNKAWDFFSGMGEADVERHLRDNLYGHRPTWRYTTPDMEDNLRQRAWFFRDQSDAAYAEERAERERRYGGNGSGNSGGDDDGQQGQSGNGSRGNWRNAPQSAETDALAIMGLEPPVTLVEIKTRYKTLAKKYHPDLNPDDPEAEELLKKINMSYTILKLAYEKFDKINKT